MSDGLFYIALGHFICLGFVIWILGSIADALNRIAAKPQVWVAAKEKEELDGISR